MSEVSTCLWFAREAEDAAAFYVSLIAESAVDHVRRSAGAWPGGVAGDAIIVEFHLGDQRFLGLNGGTTQDYGSAASISVTCADQGDVDRLWGALTANGGAEIQCGWLRDRWGVPWQIVPEVLPRLMADPDPAVAARVMQAMMGMVKLDVAVLESAARG